MTLRAFPVLYASNVEQVAGFYAALGFVEHSRLLSPDGTAGFIGLNRDGAEIAVTTEESPRQLAGVEPGPGPRHELFVYVPDLNAAVEAVPPAGGSVLREPTMMPWGERLAYTTDPEGNLVTLAAE
ncbi:VOC family protein [Tessaracoccus caeni]|uniref:VOC family protein n=1 Tax=Tessaracoccus caeni TaxID=3031239 RepID=UPI0023DA5FF0|nr:VOC family protein [Tessaracoccus caeni]MDF1489653.1 bleomycin resistance protein [Tessaracoccus caeni]